jgi:hypothetical protein
MKIPAISLSEGQIVFKFLNIDAVLLTNEPRCQNVQYSFSHSRNKIVHRRFPNADRNHQNLRVVSPVLSPSFLFTPMFML